MNIEKHLQGLLRPIFPRAMEIKRVSSSTESDVIFRAHALHCRPVEINFTSDVLDDYRDDPTYRRTMDTFISAYLRSRFAQYKDDGVLVPLKWRVEPEHYLPGPPQGVVRRPAHDKVPRTAL